MKQFSILAFAAVLTLTTNLFAGDLIFLDNLAENPSFDQDENRDQLPDGWVPNPFQSGAGLNWDKTVSRSEKGASLRIRNPKNSGSKDWQQSVGRWASPRRPVEPGSLYALEIQLRTENVSGRAKARISWQDKEGNWLDEVSSEDISGSNDWKKITLSATAPAAAESLSIILELGYGPGTVWFDDLVISGKSTPLPHIEYTFNDTNGWFPFTFSNSDINLDSINLTRFLDAPAGKHGFVSVRNDGHFYYENGKRARFFGVNLGGRDCAPDKKTSRAVAARFAKYGVNMVRLHSIDSTYAGIIDYTKGNSQNFDKAGLDRMDFLISELKKNGIYVYLDLLDYRMFGSAEGVKHGDEFTHNWAGSMKGASIFDKRMIELQKDYATKLLTHKNPYTGHRYVDDPAIALLEIANENSVFYFLMNRELSHPYYREQLAKRWNAWLLAKYGKRKKLKADWTASSGESELFENEDPEKNSVKLPAAELVRFSKGLAPDRNKIRIGDKRTRDALIFLGEIQDHYYEEMVDHLKKEIGIRIPLTGTNQTFVLRDTEINARRSDFISRNQYWRHPSVRGKPFFKFANESMVRSNLAKERGPFTVFASSSVEGKPTVLAEFNFPWPNEYRCEGLIMGTAYACLQDWDAVLLFSFALDEAKLGFFRSQSDPARWGGFPAAALMFHRQDVAVARNEVHVAHTADAVTQLQPDERYAPFTNFRYLTFLSKVRRSFLIDDTYSGTADLVLATGQSFDAKLKDKTSSKIVRLKEKPWEEWLYPKFVKAAKEKKLPGYEAIDGNGKRFDSDTGELSLDYGRGLFTADTPESKSIVAYLPETGVVNLSGFIVDGKTNFAAITLNSLDDKPVGSSQHLLLTCLARAENTAQGFWPQPVDIKSWSPYTQWMLPGEGRLPVIAEPVHASIKIPVPGNAKVYSLDETGKRRKSIPALMKSGILELDPSTARSIWCEIVVEKK